MGLLTRKEAIQIVGRDKEKSSPEGCGDIVPGNNRFWSAAQMGAWLGQAPSVSIP